MTRLDNDLQRQGFGVRTQVQQSSAACGGFDVTWRMWPAPCLRAGWQVYWPTRDDLLHVFHAGLEYRFGS